MKEITKQIIELVIFLGITAMFCGLTFGICYVLIHFFMFFLYILALFLWNDNLLGIVKSLMEVRLIFPISMTVCAAGMSLAVGGAIKFEI